MKSLSLKVFQALSYVLELESKNTQDNQPFSILHKTGEELEFARKSVWNMEEDVRILNVLFFAFKIKYL